MNAGKSVTTAVMAIMLCLSAHGQATTSTLAETTVTLPGGIEIVDLKIGEGPEVTTDSRVRLHYTGWLASGKVFEVSRDRVIPMPLEFTVGTGGVISGMETAVVGMKKGGVRRARIPAALAYGSKGRKPSIPPDADLSFEMDLVDILPPPVPEQSARE